MKEGMRMIHLRLSDELHANVKRLAKENGETIVSFAQRAVAQMIQELIQAEEEQMPSRSDDNMTESDLENSSKGSK